ncbi:MAG: tRNA (guanosine(37)-N1)-methyltransferase TrmD [Bacteroidales bacterium]|jgi:tRNA (guanine37-N1)-methyltransferase|nr:tRNA (guanosine(37)-N1)-methyltransferase TrmD [Bacteroidales bacterium]
MRIDILTLFPDSLDSALNYSIVKRAREQKLVKFCFHNIRDYSIDKHKRVDDYAYSGGAGMVMMIQPVADCIAALKKERNYDEVIYTAPDGEMLTQSLCNRMSSYENIIILCGHYKGIDERIREHFITKEISVGNYVLTGGELAAAVIADSIVRLIPGVLNDETSALSDSFQDNLISPPVYTRPADYNGWKVPEILLSGNEKMVKEWQLEQSIRRTRERRPELLNNEEI